ncbi:EH domain-containing protein 1 [Liparis tanakae]|uniref:EH domain-containing protein 1 n=1 Tax=Liparis tanakae TaxID=230148 RepID=A0A4Z2FQU6_9TELE|nr:EH domain-containing protein 1 [Liparis tanakae]
MFSWLGTDDRRKKDPEVFQTVSEGLKKLYKTKLLPLEESYKFHDYLLEQDFPGMRIGPEPTTDSFIAVMHGDTEGVIPGNALVVDPKKPFRKLNAFGNAFLNR